MRKLAMVVSYDGTSYDGFQKQPSGNTIQDKLEEAIRSLTGEQVHVTGSGRTDAGVHARGQVIHFATSSLIPVERWSLAMNARLPEDIVVLDTREVPAEFHARKSAVAKTYRYTINNSKFPDVTRRQYELHYPRPLDVEAMRRALRHLEGEHDFTSFSSAKAAAENRVRRIFAARLLEETVSPESVQRGFAEARREDGESRSGDGPDLSAFEALSSAVPISGGQSGRRLTVELTGSGFLYNMVRIIVGTLLLVGRGKLRDSDIPRILAEKNRYLAGPTAPACGLTLWRVYYPDLEPPTDNGGSADCGQ